MSRIQFEVVMHQKTFPVVVGWDRILGQCHLGISDRNLDDEDYDDPRFDAVLDAGAKGLSRGLQVSSCKAILADAAIEAPPGTFELLEQHVMNDSGNLVVHIAADGKQTVLYDENSTATQ